MSAAFEAALRRKKPDPTISDHTIGRIKKAATRWLGKNDKPSARKLFVDRKRKERARRSARMHPLR